MQHQAMWENYQLPSRTQLQLQGTRPQLRCTWSQISPASLLYLASFSSKLALLGRLTLNLSSTLAFSVFQRLW